MQRLILALTSNLGLGYIPFAPGTFGTLAGIPAFFLLSFLCPWGRAGIFLALLLVSFWLAGKAGKFYGIIDDKRIVIDELVGYLTGVLWFSFSWPTALAGFALFRFFDILKPWPVCWFDRKMKNAFGVVLDDLMAGLYTAAILCIAVRLW